MMRITYWQDSRFAELILGEKKPKVLDLDAWDAYEEDLAKRKPIRYFVSQTLLGKLQDNLYWPLEKYEDFYYYLKNRWVTKPHLIQPKCFKAGQWYDYDTRLVECMFQLLETFVEDNKEHLEWSTTLKLKDECCYDESKDSPEAPAEQAIMASEVLAIYDYVKNIRSKYEQEINELYDQAAKTREYYSKIGQAEQRHYQQDEEMLIRLIKIRAYLWT